jgi:two-component system response regulator YesN
MFQVLIVEDSRLFRHVFKETLRTRFPSFAIYEAANGEEALRIIRKTSPDLIFMDIRLPEVNGLDLIKKIKARHPKIVTVVLTGYDTEYREVALECADYFLSKRSTSEDVFALIENILPRNKAGQANPASLGEDGRRVE